MRFKLGVVVFVYTIMNFGQCVMAEDNNALSNSGIQHMHYSVAGIAQDSCGKFYQNYNPQILNKYHFETLSFISGFLTAFSMQEAVYGKNHYSEVGHSTDEVSIALMMHNYCLKNPDQGVDNAIYNVMENLKEKNY